jgi:multidrug efflux pump subunit AcrA (membrane-fusion protein)
MRIEPGTELYTVADLSRVWIEADFYESEAPWLEVGRRARLELPYAPGAPIVAEVGYVYPRLDAGARTVRARFDVANPDLRLKPGMFVDVVVEVGSAPGVLVPDSAIVETGARRLVFVATGDGRFEPRAVELLSRGDGTALLAGDAVRPGEAVVVKANFLLDSESRLRAALASMAGGDASAAAAVDPHAAHRPSDAP